MTFEQLLGLVDFDYPQPSPDQRILTKLKNRIQTKVFTHECSHIQAELVNYSKQVVDSNHQGNNEIEKSNWLCPICKQQAYRPRKSKKNTLMQEMLAQRHIVLD